MKFTIEVGNKTEAKEAIELLYTYISDTRRAMVEEKPMEKVEAEKQTETTEAPEEEIAGTETTDITLAELTRLAKEAVQRTDRATVKAVISKYAPKLSEVDEKDYNELAKAIQAIGE